MNQENRFTMLYVMLALFGVMILHDLWVGFTQIETIPYSRFLELLDEDRIAELYVTDKSLSGTIRDPQGDEKQQFVTVRVDEKLADRIAGKNIKMTGVVQSTFLHDLLSWVVPALIFVGIWVLAMRYFAKKGGMGGSFMTVGKSKAKVYVETDTKKSFQDVAGADEAKDELIEVVNFLKNPETYGRLGARMPKGILLVGPPGTGKTLLAKAVAGEAAVPFFSISGSEFVEMFVGVGAARVRDLFEQARTKAPCIVFIDELDALGRTRAGAQFSGGHDEKEQTLNQLLVEMDGFDSSTGIVLLAATNRPEVLDPALLRAGRFDRQVLVDRPDKIGRVAILKVHLKNIKNIDQNLDLDAIAAMSTGFSGADLENLVNEAALVATRRNGQQVTTADFNEAIERIVAGLERRNRVLNEKERRVVAYHEMGHAIVGAGLRMSEKLHKVSIIPRGIGALGYTIQRPTEDRFLMTRDELENKITVLFGGRAAEEIVFSHLSTGAADDISRATNIARSMVVKYGMNEKLGFVDLDEGSNDSFLGGRVPALSRTVSEETAREIDVAVREIIADCYDRASKILQNNREILETSATTLLEKETLDEHNLASLLENLQTSPHPATS
ncbi:MAG: cell division protein FtsH [Desulfobulbaceae bacterium DB1]|nr:MAG: cell division protein FtsH [Desulfobulbaceae bacterium DB1]